MAKLNNMNKRALIKMYIESHPGASITETARETGASRAMVSIVRAELKDPDSLPPARSVPQSFDEGSEEAPTTFEETLQKVLAGQAIKLTPAQQAQLFSELAMHPRAHPSTRISALNGLRALEASAAQTNDIGPGPPLTPEDRIYRLALLLEACGPELSAAAWMRAFSMGIPSESTTEVAPPSQETPSQGVDSTQLEILFPNDHSDPAFTEYNSGSDGIGGGSA